MKSFYKILALLCLLPGVCFGQGAHRIGQVLSRGSGIQANVVPYAQILVCPAGTNCATTSSLFSNITLTITKANPVTADANGVYDYYAASACYDEHISAPGVPAYTVSNVCSVNGSSSGLILQHNGTNLPDQSTLNFNDTAPAPPAGNTNITFQTDSGGDLSGYVPTSSAGNCPEGDCVVNPANATQTVTQPQGTTLQSNVFANQFYANLFGTGSNGIETVYGNSADCLPQGYGISMGCNIQVSPLYTNADAPQGWKFGGLGFGGEVNATLLPPGGSAYDIRNGTTAWLFHDPLNPITGANSGLIFRTDWDLNLQQRYVRTGNGEAAAPGMLIEQNAYAGGFDFLFYPFMTEYVAQDYRQALNITQEKWTPGIDFGIQEVMNSHAPGDALLHWERLWCSAGILAGSSEGCEYGDFVIGERPSLAAGTISAFTATSVTVNCTQDCSDWGQERLLVDFNGSFTINGNFFTSELGPQTTGSVSESAVMPPMVTDTAQTFPVSTMFQLCNAGANNGEGGAAGCTAGNQPIGVIPPLPLIITVTGGSVSGGTGTFTNSGTQGLVAGQPVILYGFSGNGAPLNNTPATVLSAGLSTTGFEVSTSAANITSTGGGFSTQSPTGFSPAQSIVLNVVAPYTGTGGNTNGTPTGFCTSSTLQSSSSGSACYLPASGVLYLTDGIEYESDNYTYNSGTQQVTITNMMFPHLNGVVGAYGGLAGYALQDNANLVNAASGVGVTGTIAPTYPIAGSVSATSLYYVTQRTNEQYGSPTMGLSNPSSGSPGWGAQLYFSVNASSFSISGGTVTFTLANPPGVNGDLHQYNGLIPVITTSSNTTYSCSTCAITWISGQQFTYKPSAPSGSTPTTGTVVYNNATYSIYPAVRVMSAYDAAAGKVDGKLTVYPYNTPLTLGDTARLAHYQKIAVTDTHHFVNQFQPEDALGNELNSNLFSGFFQGDQTAVEYINNAPISSYSGYGGTRTVPFYLFASGGIWEDIFSAFTAPDLNLLLVQGCKSTPIGCSSANSNFNVLMMPSLSSQNPVGGQNGLDALNYDPNYLSSTRSSGSHSGEWSFTNGQAPSVLESGGSQYYSTVRAGYYIADQQINSPAVVTSNLATTQLTNVVSFLNVINTGGSTRYNYWFVGHGIDGGTTLPIENSILLGNATLNGTNYNMLCIPPQAGFASYDILKGSTSTSIVTGLSAVGNGSSMTPPQVASYSCFADQGGSTTAYVAPVANTTGGVIAQGPLAGNGVTDSAVSVAGCATFSSAGLLSSTGSVCGSGGGGSGTVTSVGLTMPSWFTIGGTNPITTTGTFTISATSEPANEFLATPNGTSGGVSPRAIVSADIPTLNQNTTGTAANVTGIVAAANGGTGLNSGSSTGVPQVASGTWTISTTLPSGLSATSMTLTSPTLITPALGTPASGVGTNLTGIPLASAVTGNLPNANLTTMTANSVLGAVSATTPSDLTIPSCSGLGNALTWTSGTGFGCSTISGGISGLTAGYLPIAGSSTSLTGNSHLDDGVTTVSTITSTETVATPSLLASGIVDGTAPITVTTGSTATLGGTFKSGYTYNQNATAGAAVTYTLPTAAAGRQYCVGNSYNGSAANTGILTIQTSASGQFIIFTDGTLSASGGYVISAGAGGDFACVVGVDATHWYFRPAAGTWSKH